jgi:putative salt-induced outer membrane protein YdiY
MNVHRINLADCKLNLARLLICLAFVSLGLGAEPVTVLTPAVATNSVLTTNAAPPDLSWGPPADNSDWIQLKSGEWLKGRIKALQERRLEFDSEELDLLKFNWEDVRQVRSPHTIDVLFANGTSVSGPVTITPEQVEVGGASPRVFPRDQLQSLAAGGSKERRYWTGNAALGLSVRSGNTEETEFNAQARLKRRTPGTRLSFDYLGNISEAEDAQSANNQRLSAEFDLWLQRRVYLLLPFAEYFRDPFQNLANRITIGTGVGYDLFSRQGLEWNITTGPAFQRAWFDSNEPGEPRDKDTAALVFGTRLEWEITDNLKWVSEYRGQYTSKDAGETTHHSVNTLSFDLTKRFSLNISFLWDRIAIPKVGADGIQPKPDDYRLVVGLGVKL